MRSMDKDQDLDSSFDLPLWITHQDCQIAGEKNGIGGGGTDPLVEGLDPEFGDRQGNGDHALIRAAHTGDQFQIGTVLAQQRDRIAGMTALR